MFLSLAIKVEIDFSCCYEHFPLVRLGSHGLQDRQYQACLLENVMASCLAIMKGCCRILSEITLIPCGGFQTLREGATSEDEGVSKLLVTGT